MKVESLGDGLTAFASSGSKFRACGLLILGVSGKRMQGAKAAFSQPDVVDLIGFHGTGLTSLRNAFQVTAGLWLVFGDV